MKTLPYVAWIEYSISMCIENVPCSHQTSIALDRNGAKLL